MSEKPCAVLTKESAQGSSDLRIVFSARMKRSDPVDFKWCLPGDFGWTINCEASLEWTKCLFRHVQGFLGSFAAIT